MFQLYLPLAHSVNHVQLVLLFLIHYQQQYGKNLFSLYQSVYNQGFVPMPG